MKLFGLSSKTCALMIFFVGLCISGCIAWKIGIANATEIVLVAKEKIVGAEPTVPIEQIDVQRGLLFGIPVFAVGGLLSTALAELYYGAMRSFRREA